MFNGPKTDVSTGINLANTKTAKVSNTISRIEKLHEKVLAQTEE